MHIGPPSLQRLAHRVDAVLIDLPHLYEVRLIEVSLRGATIRTRGAVDIEVCDHARLRVLTDKGRQAFEVDARVAYRSALIIGLDFDGVDRHSSSGLQRLVGSEHRISNSAVDGPSV